MKNFKGWIHYPALILVSCLQISMALAGEVNEYNKMAPAGSSMSEAHGDGVTMTANDIVITAKVKQKLATEDSLKDSKINVQTTNGVVTLSGSTTSPETKSIAEAVASSIEGVKSVDSSLKIASGNNTADQTKRALSDGWITTKVKSGILADSVSKGIDVKVETTNGVVALKGTLPNQDDVDRVKDIASKVKGVKSVDTSALLAVN